MGADESYRDIPEWASIKKTMGVGDEAREAMGLFNDDELSSAAGGLPHPDNIDIDVEYMLLKARGKVEAGTYIPNPGYGFRV